MSASPESKAAVTSYRLEFLPLAKQEWDKLDGSIRSQFAKVLLRRLENPRVPAAALTSMPDCYKIKLRSAGFRLVYLVQDTELILLTIAVGKRDKSAVYNAAQVRVLAQTEQAESQTSDSIAVKTLIRSTPRK
jgi:mRNA interferase RelE/StbE